MLLGAYLYAQHRAARERHAAAIAAESRRRLLDREATYRERAAIARELHDVVAHHLASIALRSSVARDVLPNLDPAARTVLDEIHGAAALTLNEMRRLVMLLRVPANAPASGPVAVEMLDPSELMPELGRLVDGVRALGLPVDLRVTGNLEQIDSGQALTILRIAQEGLTNVLRHAGAGASASVRIDLADSILTMRVTDSRNTRLQPVRGSRGFGLVGLRERVELLGGSINAGPAGTGWEIFVTFRLDRLANSGDLPEAPTLLAPVALPPVSVQPDRIDTSSAFGLVRRQ
jgi:signal transduction histidine kinase